MRHLQLADGTPFRRRMTVENEKTVRSLIRGMRGSRTQLQMSQELGYKFNQWHKWESGQKAVSWEDFKKICANQNIALLQALQASWSSVETLMYKNVFLDIKYVLCEIFSFRK